MIENRTYGDKYDPNLDIVEIAKCVRADIKVSCEVGALPAGLRTSVRTQRYTGGQSITIRYVAYDKHEGQEVRRILQGFLNDYNYDGSDVQADHFDVNFYGRVQPVRSL